MAQHISPLPACLTLVATFPCIRQYKLHYDLQANLQGSELRYYPPAAHPLYHLPSMPIASTLLLDKHHHLQGNWEI
jgi:hypothetical protein